MTTHDVELRARILRERARKTADRTGLHLERAVRTRVVVARIGEEHFGLPYDGVREIRSAPPFTSVPGTPVWLLGLLHDRGELVSVIDLAHFFGVGRTGRYGYVALLRGERGPLGVGFDELIGFREVYEDEFASTDSSSTRPLSGMTRDLVSLVDVARILASDDVVIR